MNSKKLRVCSVDEAVKRWMGKRGSAAARVSEASNTGIFEEEAMSNVTDMGKQTGLGPPTTPVCLVGIDSVPLAMFTIKKIA